MRWQGRRESDNVEDRRGQSSGGGLRGPGIPLRGKSGLLIVVVVMVAGYYGVDLSPLISGEQPSGQSQSVAVNDPQQQKMASFTKVTLGLTEDTWHNLFKARGKTYQEPHLVMYSGATRTGCGTGQSVMGPFYCPADSTVYIDLSFYQDLKTKFGAGGDFAQAYVIAHEVGHHVQHLMGIDTKVRQQQQGLSTAAANALSVKMELQADCFAGVWGYAMEKQQILEPGDLQQALNAAQAIGDDRLQQQSQGRVVPDSFTHGTSQQRYTWFKQGYDSGNPDSCNTFASR